MRAKTTTGLAVLIKVSMVVLFGGAVVEKIRMILDANIASTRVETKPMKMLANQNSMKQTM